MATKITVGLSAREFRNAAKQVQQYKKELNRKCQEFCKVLVEYGRVSAVRYGNQSPLGNTVTFTTEISPTVSGCKALLMGAGQARESSNYGSVNTLLLIEFGAGIHYNEGNSNPKQEEFGMGVGTFPGQVHAMDPGGWYYMGDDGQWHHSYGVKAEMPMYNAAQEMRTRIAKAAREVFK